MTTSALARPQLSPRALPAAVVWVVLTSATWAALGPTFGLGAAVVPPLIAGLITYSWLRLVAVIGGGLFVLGSTSDVSANKLIYSALVVFCLVVAGIRLLRDPPVWVGVFRPLLPAAVLLSTVLVVGSLVGGATSLQSLGRQSIFYLLIVGAPVLGIDAGRQLPTRWVQIIVFASGLIAAAGFAADWLDRRGVSSLQFGRFVVSSLLLPAYGFAFALVALALTHGLVRRLPWLIAVVFIPIAMLVTGTRTNLILFLAVIGVIGPRRLKRLTPSTALTILIIAAGFIAVIFPLVAGAVVSQPDFIAKRISLLLNVFAGDTGGDQSYQLREQQYQTATTLIDQHPVFGVGVGYALDLVLDTPLASVARIGWLGVGCTVIFLLTLAYCIHKATKQYGPAPAMTAFWGFGVVVLAQLPFGTPLDDRAFGFTLTLIVAAVASAVAHRDPTAEGSIGLQPAIASTNTSANRSGV